jgi:hypothetical protein
VGGGQSSFGVRAGAVMASCAAGFLTHCAMVDTIDGRFDQINRSSAYARAAASFSTAKALACGSDGNGAA